MKLSSEEFRQLLQKWNSERARIFLLLRAPGDVVLNIPGFITELEADTAFVVSDGRSSCVIPFSSIQSMNYTDPREAPPQTKERSEEYIQCALELQVSSSMWVLLYEIQERE